MITRPTWTDEAPVVELIDLHKRFHRAGAWPWSPRQEVHAVAGASGKLVQSIVGIVSIVNGY